MNQHNTAPYRERCPQGFEVRCENPALREIFESISEGIRERNGYAPQKVGIERGVIEEECPYQRSLFDW